MEELLRASAHFVQWLCEAAAVAVVGYGAMEALVRLAATAVGPRATHGARKAVWRRFGVWLLLALEFELASDIIVTVLSPTWKDLGELGAIAVVRTFLNYFLERDLDHAEDTTERGTATLDLSDAAGGGRVQRRALESNREGVAV